MSMGGGGGGQSAPTQQTVTQTNIPEYARPYFENLLQRGEAESYRQYTPYQGERLAGFTPNQVGVQREVMDMETPGQYGVATGLAGAGGLGSLSMGQQAAETGLGALEYGADAAGYGAAGAGIGAGALGYGQAGADIGQQAVQLGQTGAQYGRDATGYGGMGAGIGLQAADIGRQYFGAAASPEVIQALSSPYMQGVVDVQQRKAIDAARQAQLGTNLSAGRSGTYGGTRQAVLQGLRESGLRQEMGDIQAKGLQSAYEQAMKSLQYGSDLGLRGYQTGIEGARTGIAGTQAGMEGVRTGIAGAQAGIEGARTGIAGTQAGMEGARLGIAGSEAGMRGIQTGLEGFRTGLQGAQQATQAGATMADIGTAEQAANLARLQAQSAVGAEQRAFEQQQLDQQYADFLRQRDYPMEQLGYYSNLLRGLPMQMGSTQTTYAQPPSMVSQLSGLGLAGLGLSKIMG